MSKCCGGFLPKNEIRRSVWCADNRPRAVNSNKIRIFALELIQYAMNLREIKKDIEYVIGAFVDDCALFLSVHPGKNADEVANLIDGAVDLFNDLRDRLGKPEGNKRAYYDGIRKELLEKTDALYDKLSEAVKKGLGD